jgi:putative peptidoglycan lipid II flippase
MALARDVTTVGGGTLVSRLLAYARDAGIAAMLGATPFSEAFFAVLQVINFFRRLLAEGALNSAFVPIWLRLRQGEDGVAGADRLTRQSLVAMLCIAGVVTMLAIGFAYFLIVAVAPGFDEPRREVAAFYLPIAAPYIVLAGLVAVISAALNAEGRVVAVTICTIIFNLVLVLAVALAFGQLHPFLVGVWLAAAITVAGVIQFVFIAAAWLWTGKRWRRAHARNSGEVQSLFKRAAPGLIAAGIPQLKLIAASAVASSAPAAVSWLYYANRLYELPLGVASVAIASVLGPRIAASVLGRDAAAAGVAQSRAFEIALGLALPAAAAFALMAEPIAGALFQHGAFGPRDTAAVAGALAAISAGLPGHVLEKVLGAVSFAHEDTRTPMLAALAGLATAIVGALLLFPHYGHVGVAAAIGLSGWVGAALLATMLSRRRWLHLDRDSRRRIPRIIVATLVMAIAIVLAEHGLPALFGVATFGLARVLLLTVLVAIGFAVYLVMIQAFGVARLRDIMAAIGQRGVDGP